MVSLIDESEVDTLELPAKKTPSKKKSNHYVDNEALHEAFVQYNEARVYNHDNGLPSPQIPNTISEAILKVAKNLTYKSSFYHLRYKGELEGDGIENFLLYGINNYDHTKYKNPFAYITQCISQAFVRRIKKEERQEYYVLKSFSNAGGFEAYEGVEGEDNSYVDQAKQYFQDFETKVNKYEEKMKQQLENGKLQADEEPEEEEAVVLSLLETFIDEDEYENCNNY